MTFEELRSAVGAARNADGLFALTLSTLGSPPLDELSARFFAGGQFQLTGATVHDSPTTVTVRGSGAETPFTGTTVVVEFFLVEGVAALRAVATASGPWSFPQA
ncbi:MAG TPA: hypothetical protein VGB15_03050, partial [Longimicrobium sp.]